MTRKANAGRPPALRGAASYPGLERYGPGDPVLTSGVYIAVDEQGNRLDYDTLRLEAGDCFPGQGRPVSYIRQPTG